MSESDEHIASSPRQHISKKYLFLSVGLSLLGLAVVIYFTYDPDTDILKHLKPERFPLLVIALIVSMLRVWFTAAKIRFLSERQLGWLASFRAVLAWDFTSAVTPSTIGGAPLATYAMSKEGLKLGKSTAIVLYGVLLDQLWFALIIPFILFMGLFHEIVPENVGLVGDVSMILIYAGILCYAGLLAYGVLRNPTALKKFIKSIFKLPLLRKFKNKVETEAEHLEEYSHELRKKPVSFLLKAFSLSSLAWIARISLPTIVILGLLPADAVLSFLRSLAMNLAFLVMPTPGGSGGAEGLFAIFQGPLIDQKALIGLSVFLWRVISYYISIGFGMMAVTWYINQSIADNLKTNEKEQTGPVTTDKQYEKEISA